ncbi:MAG TPA: transposase [Thermomicrobiales bacterium]|nr:transposase [Thermomicrobiales bacterium]
MDGRDVAGHAPPDGLGPGLHFAGALDRSTFDTFVADLLVPSLRPSDIVVLDNLSVHQRAMARQRIEAVGAQLGFGPTSSPDFNPTEQAFAKLKHLLRQTAARSVDAVLAATQHLSPRMTCQDTHGSYRHAGYTL